MGKKVVQLHIILGDAAVGGLGQLVVADEEMDLARLLTFEGGDEVEQLVGTVAAGRVAVRPVNDFLQDEMPGRVVGEVGDPEQAAEVVDVAVEVAGDEDFGGTLQIDDAAAAAGRGAEGVGGSLKGRQKAVGVGHYK